MEEMQEEFINMLINMDSLKSLVNNIKQKTLKNSHAMTSNYVKTVKDLLQHPEKKVTVSLLNLVNIKNGTLISSEEFLVPKK